MRKIQRNKRLIRAIISDPDGETYLHGKPTTPPDGMVLSILQPRTFSCDANNWGIQNESTDIEAYIAYQDLGEWLFKKKKKN